MNVKRQLVFWGMLLVLLFSGFSGGGAEPFPEVVGGTTDGRFFFAPKEPIVFELRTERIPAGAEPVKWRWQLWRDGAAGAEGEAVYDRAKPLRVETSLDHPGFVRLVAYPVDARGNKIPRQAGVSRHVEFNGGAGVQPEKLHGVPEPDDFDAFWNRRRELLAAVPPRAELREVKSRIAGMKTFAVSVACPGPMPLTGFLVIPEGAKPKSLPAVVVFHGYGFKRHSAPKQAAKNAITFNVNAHGMRLDGDEAYYAELKKRLSNYAFDVDSNADPERAYFYGMALRAMRAVEYMTTLPAWDGQNLAVEGGSQGGLQSLWAAGLDRRVTACRISIPWCCDLGGVTLGRAVGNWRLEYVPALNYYDPVNHARRIVGKVEIGRAGLGDYVCPPSGIAVLYNNLRCPKTICWVQGSTHGFVPRTILSERWNSSEKTSGQAVQRAVGGSL